MFAAGCLAATAQDEGMIVDTDYNSMLGMYSPAPVTDGTSYYVRLSVDPPEVSITANETVFMFCAGEIDGEGVRADNHSYTGLTGGVYSGDFVVPSHPAVYQDFGFAFGNQNIAGGELTTIGFGAFAKCHNLTSVELPYTLKAIRRGAFYDCTSLTEIKFDRRCNDVVLYPYAFRGCTALTKIDISCVSHPYWSNGNVFTDCPNLQEVTINAEESGVLSLQGREVPSITRVIAIGDDPEEPEMPFYSAGEPFLPEEYAEAVLMVPVRAKSKYLTVSPYNKFAHIETYTNIAGIQHNVPDGTADPVNIDGRRITLVDHSTTVDVYDISGRKLTSLGTANPEYTFTTAGCYLLDYDAGARKVMVQ